MSNSHADQKRGPRPLASAAVSVHSPRSHSEKRSEAAPLLMHADSASCCFSHRGPQHRSRRLSRRRTFHTWLWPAARAGTRVDQQGAQESNGNETWNLHRLNSPCSLGEAMGNYAPPHGSTSLGWHPLAPVGAGRIEAETVRFIHAP